MKNITLSLDEETYRKARIAAARRDASVSSLVKQYLQTLAATEIPNEKPAPELDTLLAWADTVAAGSVQVRANADTEGDSGVARTLGAQGIGGLEELLLEAEVTVFQSTRQGICDASRSTSIRVLCRLGHCE